MSVDPMTLGVLSNALVAAAEEMGWVLKRTSFSEAVREGGDCSASVFDANGNMVGQANYAPGHLGSSPIAVGKVIEAYPMTEMRPGDAFLLNDPSMNSGHLPDIFSIAPVFADDEIVGFTVVTAHHVDVGGAAPGSQAIVGIVDIHQEGMRILPIRYFAEGKANDEALKLIAANVRIPDQVIGDLKGQYNANMVGARRVQTLVRRFGADVYKEACAELIERSEQAMRVAIALLPEGTYEFTDFLDDYGPGTDPIKTQVSLTVEGGTIRIDFTGSSGATRSGVNTYFPFTAAYCYHAVQSVVAPHLPHNSGCMRPIEVYAPPGSFFNVNYPTPSGGRAIVGRFVVDAVYGALAQAAPSRVPTAASQLCNSTFGGVDEKSGRPFVYYDLTFGSTGARPTQDACDGLVSGFNVSNVPIEIHEAKWPILVERFGFVQDTAGAGKFRGGAAVRRDVRNLASIARLTNLHDREVVAPWGLSGGGPGSVGRILQNPETENELRLHSKAVCDIARNDVVSFQTCGGGGWGDPLARDPDAVRNDVLDEFVSREAAARLYGVVLCGDDAGAEVDINETARLRGQMSSHRSAITNEPADAG